jgi:hypothetical protein
MLQEKKFGCKLYFKHLLNLSYLRGVCIFIIRKILDKNNVDAMFG